MKPRTQFIVAVGLIILLFGITLVNFSVRDQTPAQIFPATVNRDCAPWDGSAFSVSVPMSDGTTIDISIWRSPDIKFPVNFSFPDATGQAGNALLLLPVGLPEQLTGNVFLKRVDMEYSVEGKFDLMNEIGEQFKGKFVAEWGNMAVYCG
jgi:hypothetical protein